MFVEFDNPDGGKELINPHHVSRVKHDPGDTYTELWLNNGTCIYAKGSVDEVTRKLKAGR